MTRRTKLVWGSSDVIKGDWYFGLIGVYDRRGLRGNGLAISVRGVLRWLLGVTALGYVAATALLFWLWQSNPYCVLTYTDAFFFPIRRVAIVEKKGQALIAQGTDLFRSGRYNDAARLLRSGLSHYAGDLHGRLLLADYHLLTRRRPAAMNVLMEGLTEKFPGRFYLEQLFTLAEEGEDFARVEEVCSRYLPRLVSPADVGTRWWLMERRFKALSAAGRWEEVLALAQPNSLGESAAEHRVLALFALGRASEALSFLETWRARAARPSIAALQLQVRALREAGRFAEMDRASADLRSRAPADPASAVFSLGQLSLAGREASATAALEDYLFRFGGTPENLLLAARSLAEGDNLPLLQRCVAAADERGYPAHGFRILLVQFHVRRGEWNAALDVLGGIPSVAGREAAKERVEREWMHHVIEAALSPTGSAPRELVEFLRSRPWHIRIFHVSIDALFRVGQLEAAREALELGLGMFPASARLREQATAVGAEIRARPLPIVATPAPARRWSEQAFFTQLDQFIGDGKWQEAAQHIRAAQQAKPAPPWLGARDARLQLALVRISHGEADGSAMRAAVRNYLNGDPERVQEVLDMAREFFQAGDHDGAITLTEEILRRAPTDRQARELHAGWQPSVR